jgi:hypothetical protein
VTRNESAFFSHIRTSSSIAHVADAVHIAKSEDMLTTGMERGPVYHIATLDLKPTNHPLSEFCLILALFGVFSPDYKLLGEQCYWFVDVVLRALRQRLPEARYIEGPMYHLAGKYGKVKIRQSSEVRGRLLDTFEVLAEFDGFEKGAVASIVWWSSKGALIPIIVSLLSPIAAADGDNALELSIVASEIQRRGRRACSHLVRLTGEPNRVD